MFKTFVGVNATAGAGGSPVPVSSAAAGARGPGGWEPTVLYLAGVLIGEIAAVALLSRMFGGE